MNKIQIEILKELKKEAKRLDHSPKKKRRANSCLEML
jgi:hypothetical protein